MRGRKFLGYLTLLAVPVFGILGFFGIGPRKIQTQSERIWPTMVQVANAPRRSTPTSEGQGGPEILKDRIIWTRIRTIIGKPRPRLILNREGLRGELNEIDARLRDLKSRQEKYGVNRKEEKDFLHLLRRIGKVALSISEISEPGKISRDDELKRQWAALERAYMMSREETFFFAPADERKRRFENWFEWSEMLIKLLKGILE
jgi:hypothetical protein